MQLELLFAQTDLMRLQPEHFFLYVAFTLGFLVLAWLVHGRGYKLGTTFIMWGILAVILSCGYGLVGVPTVMLVTPALTRVGFVLVLGGVTWSLLNTSPAAPVAKETDHA